MSRLHRTSRQRVHHLLVARWCACALLLVACSDGGFDAGIPASTAMPALLETPMPAGQGDAWSEYSAVVVGDRGEVMMSDPETRSGSVVVVGSGELRRYGRPGDGPGEMRMAHPLLVNDTAIVVFDIATQRILVFDRTSGDIAREMRPTLPVQPIVRGNGNTLIATRRDDGVESPAVIDLASGRASSLLSRTDAYRAELFARDEELTGTTVNIPVVGRWAGGAVLANGLTYRLGLYSRDGTLRHRIDRNFPPRKLTEFEIERQVGQLAQSPIAGNSPRLNRIREQLAEEPTRWFTHLSPPRDDGRGRLWVVVSHGDSTTADVYSGAELLGTSRLDCPGFAGRWDVSGEWLVLLCTARDPDSIYDAEIRRWRIVD
jgi:hypothetical protein